MNSRRAFTILEMLIVLGIIGFLAAMALPHLKGFTQGSAMTAATQQMLDDCAYARQRAIANHSEVDMVFLPPNFFMTNGALNTYVTTLQNNEVTNLINYQCAAYALYSSRTVGDQPGRPTPHYLTDWRFLPKGVIISPMQLTNNINTEIVSVTNTITGITNGWYVNGFAQGSFPFPSTYYSTNILLPYIGFGANGQLTANADAFILLESGSLLTPMGANNFPMFTPPFITEIPPGNSTNNANAIHIDWLTARATLEKNHM